MAELFLKACRGEPVERTPIWLMRQAGRYLPEYQALRKRHDFMTLCRTPELATEVTLQPIRRLSVDAAILFSDILIPALAMGFSLEFTPGPVIDPPVRDGKAVDRIRNGDVESELSYVYETIRLLRRELPADVPLIGFGAAPFTLAAYLVEGRGSRDFRQIKGLLYGDPPTAQRLLERVTQVTVSYLEAQVRAGAQAIQLFDSWAGLLSPATYDAFALRYARQVLDALRPSGVPLIYFALDAAHLLERIREVGANVIGVDWRMPLDVASARLDHRFVLQGNLDPCLLLTSVDVIETETRRILAEAAGLRGHVFNLGHGVRPDTPVDRVEALVRTVRRLSRRKALGE